MQLSRLFAATFVVSIASVATIVSCGDDGGSGAPDAKKGSDAGHHDSTPGSDATPGSDGSSAASGTGTDCTGSGSGDASLCPTSDPACVSLTGTAFFCTKECGTSAGSDMVPNGGDAMCQTETSTGTLGCALHDSGSGGTYTWACAIECGTYMMQDLGTCPSNLTCTSNICQ